MITIAYVKIRSFIEKTKQNLKYILNSFIYVGKLKLEYTYLFDLEDYHQMLYTICNNFTLYTKNTLLAPHLSLLQNDPPHTRQSSAKNVNIKELTVHGSKNRLTGPGQAISFSNT